MFRTPFRHVASDVLHDLITAFLVAVAALTASGLLDRRWVALCQQPSGTRRDPRPQRIGACARPTARGLAGSTQRGARPAVDSNGRLMAVTAA
jgi:hypothetical protein